LSDRLLRNNPNLVQFSSEGSIGDKQAQQDYWSRSFVRSVPSDQLATHSQSIDRAFLVRRQLRFIHIAVLARGSADERRIGRLFCEQSFIVLVTDYSRDFPYPVVVMPDCHELGISDLTWFAGVMGAMNSDFHRSVSFQRIDLRVSSSRVRCTLPQMFCLMAARNGACPIISPVWS